MIGSILPDAIDKPLDIYLLKGFFGDNGRIFSHTLLFALVILLAGILVYLKYKRLWLLPVGLGVVTHLVFDHMWSSPRTLFWPVWGFAFPAYPEANWLGTIFKAYHTSPTAYVPEIFGGLILLGFLGFLLAKRRTRQFLRRGLYLV
jgi:inner membrane protein